MFRIFEIYFSVCRTLFTTLFLFFAASIAQAQELTQIHVFVSGEDGIDTYRIPSVVVTQKGTLLAFCEARKETYEDQSPINLVMKRSFDNGATWGPMQIILPGHGKEAIVNPCPVVDQSTGEVFLFYNFFPDGKSQFLPGVVRQLWLKSTDEGTTWSEPVDITEQVSNTSVWAGVGCGPGVGIQLTRGRLIIPCWHFEIGVEKESFSNVIYSDDHGLTWHYGSNIPGFSNEHQAVELIDGTLMENIRCHEKTNSRRIAISKDSGQSWLDTYMDKTLKAPGCQASILRYTKKSDGFSRNRILFSNPAHPVNRKNMAVRVTYDEGKTWSAAKTIYPRRSSYSCLAVLKDMTIGCLYERDYYRRITFARFDLEWLTDGKDRLTKDVGLSGHDQIEEIPQQTCLDYGRSFINTKAIWNSPRFWVESRCRIMDRATGQTVEYFQCGSCKSENTFAQSNLFQKDNYDFLPVFSSRECVLFRRYSRWINRYRQVRSSEGLWEGHVRCLRTFEGRELESAE